MPQVVIGIVGSRRRNGLADYMAVEDAFRRIFKSGDKIVSGGCPTGGDRFAEILALRQVGVPFEVAWEMSRTQRMARLANLGAIATQPTGMHPTALLTLHLAEWARYGRSAGFKRNTPIAQDADILIACVAPDRTGGTEDTIKKYQKFHPGIEVILV